MYSLEKVVTFVLHLHLIFKSSYSLCYFFYSIPQLLDSKQFLLMEPLQRFTKTDESLLNKSAVLL